MISETRAAMPVVRMKPPVISNSVSELTVSSQARQKAIVSIDKMTCDVLRLSFTEKLICETWVEQGTVKACVEEVWKQFRRRISPVTVRKWLDKRPLVRQYVLELLRKKGAAMMTREEWSGRMMDIIRDDREVNSTTPYFYKLIGEANGWFAKKGEEVGIKMKNVQINILQKDGGS